MRVSRIQPPKDESCIGCDGSLHIRRLRIAPSDLWSPEFARYYARSSRDTSSAGWDVPARTAPKSEWDRFDAWFDERYDAPLLVATREQYAVDVLATSIANVRAAVVTPKGGIAPEHAGRVLINLHGGGFVFGRGLTVGQIESIPVAAIAGMKVITLDYRQAPFHRYPAASEDVEAVYRFLLKEHKPESIGLYGCSAGGILAAQTISRFHIKGLPRPGAAGIFCMAPPPPFSRTLPWDRGWGDSGIWFSRLPKNEPSDLELRRGEMASWYMEGADLDDPAAYPGSSDATLSRFPPTLFLSGTRDFAVSTVISAHTRFLKLGVDSSLYIMEGAPHAAYLTAVGTPEAHDAHAYVARWLKERLAR